MIASRSFFQVFYEVDDKAKIVNILAIGVKEGNRLFVGGEECVP
jgi:hypothetical protein